MEKAVPTVSGNQYHVQQVEIQPDQIPEQDAHLGESRLIEELSVAELQDQYD